MNAASSSIYFLLTPHPHIRSEALRVRGHLAEVAQLVQHRVQTPILGHQHAQSEPGKTEILAESPQLPRTERPTAYDGDVVLHGVVLEQLGERHERVLALRFLLRIRRERRRNRGGFGLDGERVDLVGELRRSRFLSISH